MRESVKQMLESNGYVLFAVIVGIYLAINLFTNTMVLTDGVLYDSFLGQMPEHHIERAIAMQHKWEWLGYVVLPLIVALRQLFASAFVAASTMLDEQGITFKQVYKSVLLCEMVLLVVAVVNFGIVMLRGVSDLQELQQLNIDYHLSLGAVVDGIAGLEWLVSPLRLLCISQLLYILAIAYCIATYNEQSWLDGLETVLKGYGFLLLIVVVVLTYIGLTYG